MSGNITIVSLLFCLLLFVFLFECMCVLTMSKKKKLNVIFGVCFVKCRHKTRIQRELELVNDPLVSPHIRTQLRMMRVKKGIASNANPMPDKTLHEMQRKAVHRVIATVPGIREALKKKLNKERKHLRGSLTVEEWVEKEEKDRKMFENAKRKCRGCLSILHERCAPAL